MAKNSADRPLMMTSSMPSPVRSFNDAEPNIWSFALTCQSILPFLPSTAITAESHAWNSSLPAPKITSPTPSPLRSLTRGDENVPIPLYVTDQEFCANMDGWNTWPKVPRTKTMKKIMQNGNQRFVVLNASGYF